MWWIVLVSCQEGCLHRDLDDWCLHDEALDGPSGDGTCEDPGSAPRYRCGDYDVTVESTGFTSTSWYHRDGSLVAVQYGTDVNTYCGDFTYWYGRRVDCTLDCTYSTDDPSLPPCP